MRYRRYDPSKHKCPTCGSTQLIKSGKQNFARKGDKPKIKQRWYCKGCKKTTHYPIIVKKTATQGGDATEIP